MIGRLTGQVTQEDDGSLVVDVSGVGYEIVAPIGTVGRAGADEAGRVTFFIHTHVREDQITLFGFASEGDRLAFRTLISVSNVGPKTAIAVLSALPAADLGRAIAHKELGKLTTIAGVGKKTAERLLLELKDKVPLLEASGPRAGAGGAAPVAASASLSSNGDLLRAALVNMGYRAGEAERAIEQLGPKLVELPLPDLLRAALAVLAK